MSDDGRQHGTVAGELNDETLGECDIIVLAAILRMHRVLEAHAQRSPTPPTPMPSWAPW